MLVLFSLCIFVFVLPITKPCQASSDRLRQNLLSAGAEEDVVAGMDRASLKEPVAKQKLQLPSDADWELNMKKLEFEMRKSEKETELELARMEEKKRLLEHKFRMKELEMRGAASLRGESGTTRERTAERGDGPRWEETLAGRTKRYGETSRHVLPKMPTDVGEIPQYFESVENLFGIYNVTNDLWSKLIIPHLSDRAKTLIGRLSADLLDEYAELKKFLSGEFKLIALEYKARFDKASKRNDETHVLFASRLCNELRYYWSSRNYLSSRKVNNFDKLCDLLVSDKLKSCLSAGALNYVLSLQGNGCFEQDEIAELADTYTN